MALKSTKKSTTPPALSAAPKADVARPSFPGGDLGGLDLSELEALGGDSGMGDLTSPPPVAELGVDLDSLLGALPPFDVDVEAQQLPVETPKAPPKTTKVKETKGPESAATESSGVELFAISQMIESLLSREKETQALLSKFMEQTLSAVAEFQETVKDMLSEHKNTQITLRELSIETQRVNDSAKESMAQILEEFAHFRNKQTPRLAPVEDVAPVSLEALLVKHKMERTMWDAIFKLSQKAIGTPVGKLTELLAPRTGASPGAIQELLEAGGLVGQDGKIRAAE